MIEQMPLHSYSLPSPPCTKSAPYIACYQWRVPNQSLRVKRDDVGVDPMVGERLIGGDVVDELVGDHDGTWRSILPRAVVTQLAVVHTHLGGELHT
ncbi:glucan endo-1,3-beta-glucosidase A6 [Pyrus ussuriensis x Pyrus communis]|uniref:Glucan endo-1,3-beta-glucosidase A6 n=1 Tax=Pyrus ussuriensis x Pyrus communis TaxID=2448454 RepID=A0A5N5GSR0_9ROSA|nr:glucan endo-1,3-beta-glucosidase A6 [Pyrus ussuriensis x Pyrus communis]